MVWGFQTENHKSFVSSSGLITVLHLYESVLLVRKPYIVVSLYANDLLLNAVNPATAIPTIVSILDEFSTYFSLQAEPSVFPVPLFPILTISQLLSTSNQVKITLQKFLIHFTLIYFFISNLSHYQSVFSKKISMTVEGSLALSYFMYYYWAANIQMLFWQWSWHPSGVQYQPRHCNISLLYSALHTQSLFSSTQI